jgi:hypothetical protein
MKIKRSIIVICLVLFCFLKINAQFLFTESFVLIPIDTQKHYAGTISGSFSSQTQKETVNQLAARAELAMRLKGHHVLTVANNLQIITNGNQTILSGGYLFARFRQDISRSLYPEYYAQYQWLESRGLEQKFAITANLRKRIYRDEKLTLATAAGFMFEYEKWNFEGVKTENIPINTNPRETFNPRFNWYFSYEQFISDQIVINSGLYYFLRTSFDQSLPRIGFHGRFGYKITKNLRYNLNLRSMYDYEPIVPVSKLWYTFNNELVYNF